MDEEGKKEHLQLTMGGSGTSGGLRLKSTAGDYVFIVFGINAYQPWVDVVVDLTPGDTGVAVHPTYYGGSRSGIEKKSAALTTDAKGRATLADVWPMEGNAYAAWVEIDI